MKMKYRILILACLCLVLTGCTQKQDELLYSDVSDGAQQTEREETADECIYVYVCGEVKQPGVYEMQEGDRIYELIEQAGGLTKKASESAVNLAEEVTDGQMVVVPSETQETEQKQAEQEESDGKVDINTASKEELMTLSGIGETKAEAIISYREQNGDFSSVEDLVNVSGIAEGTLSKIKDSIKV